MILKDEFPFTLHTINCNNAGICPPPLRASEETIRYSRRLTEGGFTALINEFPGRDIAVRKKLAALLGSVPERFAITHNTAEGINTIARGYPFKKGDRILTAGKEYPANVYPWMNLKNKGIELDFVPEEPDGSLPPDKIKEHIKPGTAILSISYVEWCTGYRNDLKKLSSICREKGIHLIVDGAQGIGVLNLNLAESGIDALACPAWKWLWGPLGLGFLYMTPDFMEKITPPFVGADGVIEPEKLLDFKLIHKPDMSRFEYATKNYADIITFDKSLELTLEYGIKRIEKEAMENSSIFRSIIEQNGGEIFGRYNQENSSPIISCTFPGIAAEILNRELGKQNVLANVRDGRLRIAPHAYLNNDDAEQFSDKIKEALKASSEE